tara:strand:+ start:755 stop:949 length:195 start_codon:yes stop_codon:yes gene_type:complete
MWQDIIKIEFHDIRNDNIFIESLTIGEALKLLRDKAVELEGFDGYDEINKAITKLLEVIKVLEG